MCPTKKKKKDETITGEPFVSRELCFVAVLLLMFVWQRTLVLCAGNPSLIIHRPANRTPRANKQ